MIVVGTGEADRYLPKVLKRLSKICDVIVTACTAKDAKTRSLLARETISYDFSNYEWGKKQNIIKERFFNQCVAKENPDWIVCVDADEVLDETFTREKAEELANRDEIAYEFYCVQLWNDENHMRVDGLWGNFWNVRYFRYLPEAKGDYQRTPLHCGLAPKYAYAWRTPGEHLFKHYGYMKLEDRKKKVERYNKYDPNAKYKSSEYYDSILDKGKVVPFEERKFLRKLKYVPKRPKLNKIKQKKPMQKMYYIRNKHGKVYSVREDQLANHKRDGIEILDEDFVKPGDSPKEEELKKVEPKEDKFKCKICGKEYNSEGWLTRHMNEAHPNEGK